MRKFTTIVAALLLSVATFAQAPQGFSYQAVVRDAQNAVVVNQEVEVTLTITAEINGAAVQTYTEKHTATTNQNGLLTLTVGQGESSQKLSDIKWNLPDAIYNMRTETKYGTATTQLLSVPFAMYAEQAGDIDFDKLAKKLNSSDVQALLNFVKPEDLEKVYQYIKDSVGNTYIKKTDVNVLTNNYVTKEYFENYVISGGTPDSVDLSVYAKKTDLPNMSNYVQMRMLDYYSDTINQIRSEYAKKNFVAENYVTKEAFDNYVLSGGDAESVDLTVYAKSADVEKTYAKKSDIPSLSGYALKSDIPAIPTVPTKMSELQNDANYLTSHQDISGKQDVIDDLDDIRSGAALGATALQSHQDISGKANKSEMSITPGANSGTVVIKLQNDMQETVLTAHQSLDDYAKTADVAKTYATQTEVAGKVDKDGNKVLSTNDFTNELKTKLESGVLTEHQDISGKADKSAMSIVQGTGENADKATITLKEGTSATVLTDHQSLEALTQQIAALQEAIAQLRAAMPTIEMSKLKIKIVNPYAGNSSTWGSNTATVQFNGESFTSGTKEFDVQVGSAMPLSVSLGTFEQTETHYYPYVYTYTVTINGQPFDNVAGTYDRPTGYVYNTMRTVSLTELVAKGMIEGGNEKLSDNQIGYSEWHGHEDGYGDAEEMDTYFNRTAQQDQFHIYADIVDALPDYDNKKYQPFNAQFGRDIYNDFDKKTYYCEDENRSNNKYFENRLLLSITQENGNMTEALRGEYSVGITKKGYYWSSNSWTNDEGVSALGLTHSSHYNDGILGYAPIFAKIPNFVYKMEYEQGEILKVGTLKNKLNANMNSQNVGPFISGENTIVITVIRAGGDYIYN